MHEAGAWRPGFNFERSWRIPVMIKTIAGTQAFLDTTMNDYYDCGDYRGCTSSQGEQQGQKARRE
jgi:hypothetical protein